MCESLVDPDQHRPKRSRLRSTNGDTNINCSDAGKNDQAYKTPQAGLSTATTALQNLSFEGQQQTSSNSSIPLSRLQQQPSPTPPPSFIHQPLHPIGTSKAKFSFRPKQDSTSNHLTPPPSFTSANSPTASLRSEVLNSECSKQSEQPGSLSQSILPIHGSRNIQSFSGRIAGPSSQQMERDARHPPPQQNGPTYGPFFPSFQPILPPASTNGASVLMATNKNRRELKPVFRPSPQDSGKPLHSNDTNTAMTVDQALLEAQKQIVDTHKNVETVVSAINLQIPYRGLGSDRHFPYPGIYPANLCRFNGPNFSMPTSPPGYPPNHYTSPDRVSNAALTASRKRKRGWPTLPPPAYIYKHTGNPHFNIFGGILLYPELCFALAANLTVNDLLSLYAISKDFHTIIDSRFATVIMSQAMRKCPESSRIFHFRCFKYLCRDDPVPRIPHPHPDKQAAGEIRKVPGFKWLKMVLFREKVCHEIMALMAEDGVPLPRRCELALKRMWFVMDIPDNARRIGFMHANKLISDLDLYFMMCFFIRLDMRFNDPVGPNRGTGLRKTLLSQRGLAPLWHALKRQALLTNYDALRLWVATRYHSRVEETLPAFGVPSNQLGKIKMEYWGGKATHDSGKPCEFLLRPDQLVMREIIRRKMVFSKHYLRCLLWGYVNIVTLDNYPPRKWERVIEELAEDYEDDDECGDDVGNAGSDSLLDLGVKKPISVLVERQKIKSSPEHGREAFLEKCMEWYKNERQWDMGRMAN